MSTIVVSQNIVFYNKKDIKLYLYMLHQLKCFLLLVLQALSTFDGSRCLQVICYFLYLLTYLLTSKLQTQFTWRV